MNLSDLSTRLSVRTGTSKRFSRYVVQQLTEIFEECALSNEDITIKGLGRFVIKNRKARSGRNPRTGDPIVIPAKKVLAFRPSPSLRSAVTQPTTSTTTQPTTSTV